MKVEKGKESGQKASDQQKLDNLISFMERKYDMRKVSESQGFTPSGAVSGHTIVYKNDDLIVIVNVRDEQASMAFAAKPEMHTVAQCNALYSNRSVFSALAEEFSFIAKQNFNK